MSTSLAEQLRKLQTPQSSLFVDTKKRDSILFTQKEAATKSRETIYEIGLSGLQDLIEINSAFAEFESTLFDYTSKEVQRAVETKDVNVLLNKNIKRFFFQLSPYFLLPSSHKCLEWLIRRFNVNLYNKEEFLMLILPYHQTNMFVRCVQTMKFDDPGNKWSFLAEVKKSSTPLSKYAIWNYGANFPDFLEFVGKFTYDAIKEFGQRSGTLQTMISFYLTTIIGTLEQASVVKENHILAVVKYLIKTYKSNVIDYTAAGYMITAHLLTKSKIIVKVLSDLMERILSNVHPQLAHNVFLIFTLMFQTQSNELEISDASLEKIMEFKWCLKVLSQLQNEGKSTISFQQALIRALMRRIQCKDEKYQECKEFCKNLFNEIDFNDEDAGIVIKTVLESYIEEQKPTEPFTSDTEIISLDSDDDEEFIPFKSQDITTWYSNVLKSLENRYPMAFDLVVKEVVTASNPRKKRNCLKNVLGFLLKVTCSNDTTSVFESLYHHNPHIRTEAVSYLVENIEKLSIASENQEILKLSLIERIKDDSPHVVAEVLKIKPSVLANIIGKKEFTVKLSKILFKYWNNPERWSDVCLSALEMITSNECDQNYALMVVLPFLFPKNDIELKFAHLIIGSKFGKSIKLPGAKEKNFAKLSLLINEHLMKVQLFSTEAVIQNIPVDHQSGISVNFAIYALTASLKSTQEPSVSLNIFTCVKEVLKSSKLSNKTLTDNSTVKYREVSVELLELLTQNLLETTNFESLNEKLNFKNQDDESLLKIGIFEYLVENFFTTGYENRLAINKIIKNYLKFFCGDNQASKIEFLAQFCVLHSVNSENIEFQIQLMQLMNKAIMNLSTGDQKAAKNFSNDFFEYITIAFAAKSAKIREAALQIVEQILKLDIVAHWRSFSEKIIERKHEILMDSEQISLIIYLLISGKKKSPYSKQIIEIMLSSIGDTETRDYIQSELLMLLKHLNERLVLDTMALSTTKILENSSNNFDENQSSIIKLVLMKIGASTISSLWSLVVKSLRCHYLMSDEDGKILTPSILVLQAIENDIFVKLHPDHKMELFNAIVKCSMMEVPKIVQAARKAFQNIDLDCKIVRNILEKMFKIEKRKGGKIITASYSSDDWKFGIVLLELLQIKSKGMKNQEDLIVPLFEVLDNCLQLNYESDVEYATQIVLTLLLSICREISPNGREHRQHGINDSMLKTELVTSCIKKSPNPQTHHHALLLLAHLAQMTPDQVLHDIIPIFTFVGTALIRHDDSYSYQIIDKVIENIVPKLIRGGDANNLKSVVPILKIFSSIVLDVPEHRRLTLFVKLLNTLGAEKFLWPFVAVLLEHQVMIRKKQDKPQQQPQEELPARLHFGLLLSKEFDLKTIISTTNSLMIYIKSLPMVILEQSTNNDEQSIFCVRTHTNLQLRHYKYITAVFIKYLLESPEVLGKSQALKEDDEVDFEALISNSLLFIPTITKYLDAQNQNEKLTNLMLQNIYDVLEATIALLSPDMLLIFVEKLIGHESMHVRRRALEIFNRKLEENYFEKSDSEKLLKLLKPLRKICESITKNNKTPVEETVQQLALVSIKILSRKYSEEASDIFVEVLEQVTELLDASDKIKKEVLASLVNCIAELVYDLKVLAISMLDKILTTFVRLMTVQDDNRSTFQLIFAVSSSLLKIIETVPLFLSPYLKQMIQQISRVVPALKILNDPKIALTTGKISKIWTALAQSVPLRVLIPTVDEVYQKISEKGNFSSIEPLMELSYEIFQHAEGKELKNYQSELTDFFVRALELRFVAQSQLSEIEVNDLEVRIIRSIVALVLKQSEGSFRPFFETIFEWGIKEGCQDGDYTRALTFFRLTNEISMALKSLFLLFASDVVDSAANLLNQSNPSKSNELCFGDDNKKNLLLTEFILKLLHNIFLHDHQNFINSHRFEVIMQPVVDEIENDLVVKDLGIQQLLRLTIAQLAVAASDDILWKQLNYQVLLKTRSDTPEVRILGLKASVDVAKKLGEDFEPLIPETIPFLSELLEDDNHKVVEECQNGVRELESTVGDSLQKYF